MKKSSNKVRMFWAETLKTCAAASEYISYFLRNVWLFLGVFQCFLRNGQLLLKDINERLLLQENVQLIFCVCVAASRSISVFFNKCVADSEKIITTFSERKNVQLFLRIMSIYFAVKNRLK